MSPIASEVFSSEKDEDPYRNVESNYRTYDKDSSSDGNTKILKSNKVIYTEKKAKRSPRMFSPRSGNNIQKSIERSVSKIKKKSKVLKRNQLISPRGTLYKHKWYDLIYRIFECYEFSLFTDIE